MPLTQLTLTASLGWTLDVPLAAAFADLIQGPSTTSVNLSGIDLTVWTELYAEQFTIAASGTQTVNLNSFTDLTGQAVTALHALAFMVVVSGAATDTLNVKPAASNALQWFFGSATSTGVNVHGGGAFVFMDPAGATGSAISSTACDLLLTNNGFNPLTVVVLAVVSPT